MRSKPLAAGIRAAISPTAPAAATKSSPRPTPAAEVCPVGRAGVPTSFVGPPAFLDSPEGRPGGPPHRILRPPPPRGRRCARGGGGGSPRRLWARLPPSPAGKAGGGPPPTRY